MSNRWSDTLSRHRRVSRDRVCKCAGQNDIQNYTRAILDAMRHNYRYEKLDKPDCSSCEVDANLRKPHITCFDSDLLEN